MLTGPNWRPRKYSDGELDEIEARRPCLVTMEDLGGLMARALSRLSDEEKKALREPFERELNNASSKMPCPKGTM